MSGVASPFLMRRSGQFYVRVRVPGDLIERVGLVEVRRSLGPMRFNEARLLAAQIGAQLKEAFTNQISLTTDEMASTSLKATPIRYTPVTTGGVFVTNGTVTLIADKNLTVIARADDATFGVLHSRFHELWSLKLCTWMGKGNDPRYTPSTTFETFPFPAGLTPADTAHQRTETLADGTVIPAELPAEVRGKAEAIARAAKRLNDLRDRWLNPPEWCDRVPEVTPLGLERSPYPDRIVAKPGHEKELAKRTLTNLYNAPPAWLKKAHADLDAAVAAAYGWTDGATMTDDDILRRLLALNRERAPKA